MIPAFRGLLAATALAGAAACAASAAAALPVYSVAVKASYPHDPGAYTEGLFWLDGWLYESTGLVGQSNIRRVRLLDGAVVQSQAIAPSLFGEGIVAWDGEILSLTWRDQVGFRWDLKSFAMKSSFSYPGEGWALTHDGTHLIMSDGTPVLRVLDPKTLKVLRRITVKAAGQPVMNLNELEFVKGEVLANIWQTNVIARIDPKTGAVKGWIDVSALPEARNRRDPDAVPNGIAYDKAKDRLFLTGKNWPHLYEVTLVPPKTPPKASAR